MYERVEVPVENKRKTVVRKGRKGRKREGREREEHRPNIGSGRGAKEKYVGHNGYTNPKLL